VIAKAGYHHGDLRRALKDAAIELIGEKGIDQLSLREVAARVGVSHAAPYHHFADKSALVHALAHDGMRLLDARTGAAQESAGPDPAEQLLAIGVAYVEFAVDSPEYYAAFTSPECAFGTETHGEQPEEEGGDAWDRLLMAVVACQAAGELPPGDTEVFATALWALVHGLAELTRSGQMAPMASHFGSVGEFARHVLSVSLQAMKPKED
jgi:AcrR family transcriptional regulator